MQTTSVSLLGRLRQADDDAAWGRFVELYTPLLCYWATRLGARGSDVADLVQDVFSILVRKMPQFHYRPEKRFRGWLWTITLNKWRELQRHRNLPTAGDAALDGLTAPDALGARWEEEHNQYLVRKMADAIKAEFQPATWQAFWNCSIEQRSVTEVARELNMTENAVSIAKCRVLRRLRQELDGLLD
jgi:RNA polymerase sigma-70 factor (ECF subfamily)